MRLTQQDWLDAARYQLGTEGPSGIKIEALARTLGVSKGSFYWHFKDRSELLWQLLSYWEQATDQLIAQSREEKNPQASLHRLFQEINSMGVTGELGIFAWAKQEAEVEERVHAVEQKRIAYLCEIFERAHFSKAEARRRAEVCYMAFLGYVYRGEAPNLPRFEELGKDLLMLLMPQASPTTKASKETMPLTKRKKSKP